MWLVLGAALLVANRDLFRVPAHEEGDDAANALSIERAKHGRELLGNYSRFRFHHPGSAFFTTYAVGEWILQDGLGVVPARHNAHLLAGTLLQAFFLAGAIGLLARQTTRPALAAATLTAVGTAHFAFVPGAFVGIWPPYVLMGPLACFLVAGAVVGAGQPAGWLWLLGSAGYLLHGHVAQPMFVGPLALLAFCFAARQARADGAARWSWLPRGRTAALAAALIGLFALPLLLDLAAGRESNLYRILLHLRFNDASSRPDWWTAVQYTLSYFGYCVTQENWWFNRAAGTPADFLRQHGAPLLGWIILAAAIGGWLWRHRRDDLPARRFPRCLAGLATATFLLAIVWAKRQDGGITYFNSYFLFGLMFALLGLAVVVGFAVGDNPTAAAATPPRTGATRARLARGSLLVAALVVFGATFPRLRSAELEANARANAVARQVPAALAADRLASAPKLLLFAQDSWYEAVTVAATLQRAGVPFKVADFWDFMFGPEHVLRDPAAASRPEAFSLWHVEVPTANRGAEVVPLNHEGQLRLQAGGPPLGPWPARLRFAGDGNYRPFFPLGCDSAELDFAWTLGEVAVLRAAAAPAAGDVELRLTAAALLTPRIPRQRVVLWVDGERREEQSVTEKADYVWRVPRAVWNRAPQRCGVVQCAFELPDARVPALIGKSGDQRRLALQLFELQITLAPAATSGPTPAVPVTGSP